MEQFAYLQNNDTLEACVTEFKFFEASVNPLNLQNLQKLPNLQNGRTHSNNSSTICRLIG